MAKNKRSRVEADTYESDGGFVSDDDGNAPKSKKSKKTNASSSKGNSSGDSEFWALSTGRTPRRVNITDFKGTMLVNIREFYEKDDEYLPSKKGISLTVDQYKALLKVIPDINGGLKRAGVDVGVSELPDDDDDEEEDMDHAKPQTKATSRLKGKREKANIEETSEEEE